MKRLHLEELEPRLIPSHAAHGATFAPGHHGPAIVATVHVGGADAPAPLDYAAVEALIASLPPAPPLDTVAAVQAIADASIVGGQVVQDGSQWAMYYVPIKLPL